MTKIETVKKQGIEAHAIFDIYSGTPIEELIEVLEGSQLKGWVVRNYVAIDFCEPEACSTLPVGDFISSI